MMRHFCIAFAILALGAAVGRAEGIGELAGSADVSHVDARVDGQHQDSLRQLYTANFMRGLTNELNFRLGFRYYDFDLESADALGSYQEELQPTAELLWSHPWFRFTANGSRRISRSNVISGDLITDSLLLNWVSDWRDTPTFNLRYELQDIEETGPGSSRNIEDRRFTAGVDYQRERESFNYEFAVLRTENVIGDLSARETSQRFAYRGLHELGSGRNTVLSTSYRYSRRDRVADVDTGDQFLELVDPARGIGGIDLSPEVGALPDVPALIDGNTIAPVAPPLRIGAGQTERNIGVDLGVQRDRIGAIYVYTDRLSAATVRWSLWVSDDNQNWSEPAALVVNSRFVPSLLRYEIEFDGVSARYVKVVNSGVNTIPDVEVTEIQVFEALPVTGEIEQDASSHLADTRLVWDASRRWRFSVDAIGQIQPPTGTVSRRANYDYSLQARYAARLGLAHVLRWSQSWQDLEGKDRDLRDDSASYSLLYDPLPTLGASLSGNLRQTTEGGEASLRSANVLLGGNAMPWTTLRATAEVGLNRIDDLFADYITDSWQTRVGLDADITRHLGANVTWFHQESYSGPEDEHRVLRRVSAGAELQVTSAIFVRARMGLLDDGPTSRSDEYLVSWRLFTRILVSGQANLDEDGSGATVRRYSVTGNLDLFDRALFLRNVTAYVRFSDVDQSEVDGSRILSWQQGLRATF